MLSCYRYRWQRFLRDPSSTLGDGAGAAADAVCEELSRVELLCARATSLLYCFPTSIRLTNQLLVSL